RSRRMEANLLNIRRAAIISIGVLITGTLVLPSPATATPVCTDGYKGGPPLAACGGRIFPEPEIARSYIQFLPDPTGFREYQHGIEYLAKKYPRWISVTSFRKHFNTKDAVSAGEDGTRPYEKGDTGDGLDIFVVKITDHKVPDKGKDTLFFSLSVHGNERGGLEGGLRAAEDLAMAAQDGGKIRDGVNNYRSTTGRKPEFHSYKVKDVLKKEAIYLVDFNSDGWAVGDHYHRPPRLYARTNGMGTDLNRQMPTVGWINPTRNPLEESEMFYGHKFMHEVADKGRNDLMAHGADIHGELNSNAYVDIMYPAGQFDSVDHRRLMAIAERTKSVIDSVLYEGIIDEIESATGGNSSDPDVPIPTKPAHWATVWDTLGYTDTGFIGDYMATDLGVTGMDYELFLNHTVPDKVWNVYLQENHITATRSIIKTAMAYALFQRREFNNDNVRVRTEGRAGYVFNPDTVTDRDGNRMGTPPGAGARDKNGKRIKQRHYSATNMQWFKDTNKLMPRPFARMGAATIARRKGSLNRLDTLVIADELLPKSKHGRISAKRYFSHIKSWVKKGGNLVLTDRAVEGLAKLGLVPKTAIQDTVVYQPYVDIQDFDHALVKGLRPNARQLVEATLLGYCIGTGCSPMTVVQEDAFTNAKGHVVGTVGEGRVGVGQIKLGKGIVRVIGGALPRPTEKYDHRYGLRDYALTYSGLYIMENAIKYDAPGLGAKSRKRSVRIENPTTLSATTGSTSGSVASAINVGVLLLLGGMIGGRRLRRSPRTPTTP
ncbi:MAG: hypothetical protein M3280_02700, partial [Actinomycetota bacterium]|nr:hypothetical protein [Actinomycetota bacterium]